MAALAALVVPLVVIAVAQGTPAIKFLNPSSYKPCPDANAPCFVISDRKTSSDAEEENGENETTYRLGAWVDNAPLEALVEFEIDIPQDLGFPLTQTIGTATRVSSDTWEYHWDIPPEVVDGQYELRAILYQGVPGTAEEVARDEKLAYILTGAGTQQGTAEPAADIEFPVNGTATGFYVNPLTGRTNTIVDLEWSQGTTFVQVNYTLSDPGDDPVWKQCALIRPRNSNSPTPGEARVECVLQNVDQGGQSVTAINVVANRSPSNPSPAPSRYDPNLNQAGDVVRVIPYKQDAVSVSIDNVSVRADSHPEDGYDQLCSAGQSITVLDQNGNPIASINIDVHAHGPSDQLKYQTGFIFSDQPPSSYGPPDNAHGGTEVAYICNDLPPGQSFAGEQGEHNRPGAPDLKHVEGETDTTGFFGIGMHSDRAGGTFITFWVDEDDDDLFCSQEPSIAASIGWDEPAPTPGAETPVKTDCPIPDPPRPTGTESPTVDPTSTEDPRGCTLSGDEGDNTLEGTEGNDVICGNGGDDRITGLGGDDVIYGDAGNDAVAGGDGDDTINGGSDDDRLFGEAANDAINGNSGGDHVVGGSGNDTLIGQSEPDVIRGGSGRDIVQAGSANDFAYGGSGDDVLRGYTGNDILRGGNAADVVRAGKGLDTLFGERGPDALTGGPGRDRCRGGPGRDRQRSCER
jgi:hypothetical protein